MSRDPGPSTLADRTIADFGDQWTRFQGNEGYYGSTQLLEDIVHPLLSIGDIAGKRVAEIGNGAGRIVQILLDAGAAVWLYGKEGNRLYLAVTQPLRVITTRLPHRALLALARLFTVALAPYVWLCRRMPLPLSGYFANVFGRMDRGFHDVRAHHRHGYSWTVVGTRT